MRKNTFFLFFLSEFFSDFERKLSDFWPKNFNKLSKLPFASPEEQFVAWIFLSFESFRIFCRNLWHGSQKSIQVSRVKIAGKIVFFVFFSEFFGFLSDLFSDFWPKNFKNLWKLPSACPPEQLVALNFFKKVLNRFEFSTETFGMVLKILSTCPE